MTARIRNFAKLQHFKDRRPPWIKLYRDILDDMEWHALSGEDAKLLISLWLLASEDRTKTGQLPEAKKIAFRLRSTEVKVNQALTRLSHWVLRDDINPISDGYQDGPPETETETETDIDRFPDFWTAYPRKRAKPTAEKSFKKLNAKDQLAAIAALQNFPFSDEAKYQPHPATWLNQRRWEDETPINGHDLDKPEHWQ